MANPEPTAGARPRPVLHPAAIAAALLCAVGGFAAGRLEPPAPPPAPLDLTRPITARRVEPPNAEVLTFQPYSLALVAGRAQEFRDRPEPARRWAVTLTLDDGRKVELGCDLVGRR